MPLFKTPIYSKTNPKTGENVPCYTFQVDYASDELPLKYDMEQESEWSIKTIEKLLLDHPSWWNSILQSLLQAHSTIFSKKYTVDHIKKVCNHTIHGSVPEYFPLKAFFLPTVFQVIQGYFWITWNISYEPLKIDIPDIVEEKEEKVPSLPDDKNDIYEVNLDSIPLHETTSTDASVDRSNLSKTMDRQKVKEAHLKARLALYKAQLQSRQFYDKYGEEYEESEEEMTDGETSEEEEIEL